jgi:hypothetical protein
MYQEVSNQNLTVFTHFSNVVTGAIFRWNFDKVMCVLTDTGCGDVLGFVALNNSDALVAALLTVMRGHSVLSGIQLSKALKDTIDLYLTLERISDQSKRNSIATSIIGSSDNVT